MNYHAAKAFILDELENGLAEDLYYHGVHHTLDVLKVSEELCLLEKVSPYETMLVKTAALFHDSGFLMGNKMHEAQGCRLSQAYLPTYGYTDKEIDIICGMIMATKIPQSPQNYLESILCDADLDYLGRSDFYTIGRTLFEELKAYDVLHSEEAWNRLQVSFLKNHRFFTQTTIHRRDAGKARHLAALEEIVRTYEKN
jgi:predicted metal-dependent HD superfamily phosphohydrolase